MSAVHPIFSFHLILPKPKPKPMPHVEIPNSKFSKFQTITKRLSHNLKQCPTIKLRPCIIGTTSHPKKTRVLKRASDDCSVLWGKRQSWSIKSNILSAIYNGSAELSPQPPWGPRESGVNPPASTANKCRRTSTSLSLNWSVHLVSCRASRLGDSFGVRLEIFTTTTAYTCRTYVRTAIRRR